MKNNVILPIIFIIFFGSLYFIQLSKDAKKEQTINSVIPIITNADDIGPEELKEIKTGIFENEKYTLVFDTKINIIYLIFWKNLKIKHFPNLKL